MSAKGGKRALSEHAVEWRRKKEAHVWWNTQSADKLATQKQAHDYAKAKVHAKGLPVRGLCVGSGRWKVQQIKEELKKRHKKQQEGPNTWKAIVFSVLCLLANEKWTTRRVKTTQSSSTPYWHYVALNFATRTSRIGAVNDDSGGDGHGVVLEWIRGTQRCYHRRPLSSLLRVLHPLNHQLLYSITVTNTIQTYPTLTSHASFNPTTVAISVANCSLMRGAW